MELCKMIDGQIQNPYAPFESPRAAATTHHGARCEIHARQGRADGPQPVSSQWTCCMGPGFQKGCCSVEQVQDRWLVKHCQHT